MSAAPTTLPSDLRGVSSVMLSDPPLIGWNVTEVLSRFLAVRSNSALIRNLLAARTISSSSTIGDVAVSIGGLDAS